MKKIKLLLEILFLCIVIQIILVNQSCALVGTVNTETIRLRKEASTNSTIVELISEGEQVEILAEENDWYKVKYKGMTGYLSKQYVKVNQNSKPKEEEHKVTPTPAPTPQEPEQTVTPTPNIEQTTKPEPQPSSKPQEEQNSTNKKVEQTEKLYILPLINYSSIGEITTQDTIHLLQTVNNWGYVEVNGQYGWVIANRLTNKEEETPVVTQQPVDEPQKASEEQKEEEPKIVYVKVEQANFREEAKTDSEVIQTLKQNAKLEVIETVGDWTKVKYNQKEGYVATKLLSDTKIEVTNRSAKQRTVENTNKVEQEKKDEVAKTENTVAKQNNSSNKGSEIVAYAKQFLGSKYVYGGTSPKGFDCSGFTQYVYKHFGYNISRTATTQSKDGKAVSKSELQPGDLVIFTPYNSNKGIGHVGIYIGNNQFIHASTSKTGVIISSLNTSTYQRRYVTARRIL